MSRQKSGCGCLPLFGLLTLAAAGGAYVYFKGFPSVLSLSLPWEQFTPLEAAKVIPDDAIATTYINTDAKTWSKLSQFGTPEAQKIIRQRLEELQKESSPDGINYEQDVQPWIEDISLAFLPSATGETQVLFVLGIKDKLKAATFAQKFQEKPNQTIIETKYKEFTIVQTTTPDSDSFYSAIVGKYLLYGSDRSVIEQAIDTHKGEPSYLNKPGVKELLTQSLSLKNQLFQIYIDDCEKGVANLPPDTEIPINTLKTIKPMNAVVLGVGIEDTGLHLQAVAKLNLSDSPSSETPPTSSKLLSYFPSETLILMNGQGIKEGWTNLVKESQNDPTLQGAVGQIRENFQMANLDADKDVFGWMDREFALGLVTSDQPTPGNLGLGGVIVWETSDPTTAKETLAKLDQMSVFLPQIEVKTNQIQGKEITQWKSRIGQEVFLSYGWLDNQAIAMTVAMPFGAVLQAQSKTSLPKSQSFKEITASLPQKNFGYFYIDIEKSLTTALDSPDGFGTMLDAQSRAVLDSIKGLAMTSTTQNQTTSQYDLILSLKSSQQSDLQK